MRTSSTSKSRWSEKDKAWGCLAVNLGMSPGLGSCLAKRWVIGGLTFALALVGFTVFVVGMWRAFQAALDSADPNATMRAHAGPVVQGFVIFAVAWIFSAVDSYFIIKKASNTPPVHHS